MSFNIINLIRNFFIDELKGIAILLVVAGHILQFVFKVSLSSLTFATIYSFHMAFFMFLAGYSLSLGHKVLQIRYVLKRMLCLIVPFFIWGVVQLYSKSDVDSFVTLLLYPDHGLWFLWSLAWITFFVWVGHKVSYLIKSNLGYVILGFVLTCIYVFTRASYCGFNFITLHYVFFILGYKLNEYWRNRSLDFKNCVKICAGIIFLNLLVFWRFPEHNILQTPIMDFLNRESAPEVLKLYVKCTLFILDRYVIQISGIILTISLYQFLRKLLSEKVKLFLTFLGTRTIDIYVMHFAVVCTPFVILNTYTDAFVKFILCLIIPIVIGFLLRRNRCTAFLFLGNKLSKKSNKDE